MVQSEYFREKLAHSKFGGQAKPYIDSNLQFHLQETSCELSSSSQHPIYAHFTHSSSKSINDELSRKINEAMVQAEQSYRAWKRIHDLINRSILNEKAN